MATDKIWDKLMELSVICGMNQRYSQHLLTTADSRSEWIDIAIVIATLFTMAVAIVAYFTPKSSIPVWYRPSLGRSARLNFDALSAWIAVASAAIGMLLIVMPAGREVRRYSEMFQSWSDLRQDVDSVLADADAEKPLGGESEQSYIERRYRELLAKKNGLNAREPAPDQKFLDECLVAEEESRVEKPDPFSHKKTAAVTPPSAIAGQ